MTKLCAVTGCPHEGTVRRFGRLVCGPHADEIDVSPDLSKLKALMPPSEQQLAQAAAALALYDEFSAECEEAEYTDTGAAWEVLDAMAAALAELVRPGGAA